MVCFEYPLTLAFGFLWTCHVAWARGYLFETPLHFPLFVNCRAFDVELLYIAEALRIPIDEVAVYWTEIEGMTVFFKLNLTLFLDFLVK